MSTLSSATLQEIRNLPRYTVTAPFIDKNNPSIIPFLKDAPLAVAAALEPMRFYPLSPITLSEHLDQVFNHLDHDLKSCYEDVKANKFVATSLITLVNKHRSLYNDYDYSIQRDLQQLSKEAEALLEGEKPLDTVDRCFRAMLYALSQHARTDLEDDIDDCIEAISQRVTFEKKVKPYIENQLLELEQCRAVTSKIADMTLRKNVAPLYQRIDQIIRNLLQLAEKGLRNPDYVSSALEIQESFHSFSIPHLIAEDRSGIWIPESSDPTTDCDEIIEQLKNRMERLEITDDQFGNHLFEKMIKRAISLGEITPPARLFFSLIDPINTVKKEKSILEGLDLAVDPDYQDALLRSRSKELGMTRMVTSNNFFSRLKSFIKDILSEPPSNDAADYNSIVYTDL